MSIRRTLSTSLPFLAAALVIVCTIGALSFQHERLRAQATTYWKHRMETSADATRAALSTWLDDRQQDDRMLARQAAKARNLFGKGASRTVAVVDLADLMTEVANERGYRGIWVIRSDGSSVLESRDADALPARIRILASAAALAGKSETIGPISIDNGEQFFAVIEPVVGTRSDGSAQTLGAVVLGIDPYASLFPIVLRELDGVETPRHRLIERVGDEIVVLTPSRIPVAKPGELRLPWSGASSPARLAAASRDTAGRFLGVDGVPIIAATRHIPETGWGVIRALEVTEALAAVEQEFRLEALLASMLVLLGVAIAFGIRQRQRTMRRLAVAESEARYRLLAEHATDLVIRQNLHGEVLYVSPSCLPMLGYEHEEFVAANPIRFVHPDDVATARAAQLGAFRNPLSLPVQYRVRRNDGSYAWLETTGQPVIDSLTHELTEIVTVSRDISARREIEEEGARLAQRNALLLESAAEGIFGLDLQGNIIFINPAAERMVDWPAGELLGKSQHALMNQTRADGSANPQEYCGICMTASTGRGYASADDVFWRRDATSFPVEYQSTPIREGESVVGAVVTFRDVSARRRANLELVRAKEEAEAANAAKSEFLARMSHELRTPLNSVIGFSNVLRKNKAGNLNSLDLSYLERIGSNGVQLLALINDILDLSKIEAGKVTLDLDMVQVGELVHDTVLQLGDRLIKTGVSVEADAPKGMRAIETDSAKLRQVLINLIGNAVKFTHEGTVTVSIEMDRTTNRPLRIRVTDTGIGISPDRLNAVFAPFEQADTSTTREYGGTGLGLSISRALCELLGFRLEVESVLGQGTTFTIELSHSGALGNDVASAPIADLGHAAFAPIGDPDTPLVLVIEDDADARELLRRHVADLGYRVVMATSGSEGLRLAEELHPQLITLDLMMPGMDGWELLKRLALKPELARIPVIIVSAIAGEMRESFVGAVDWVDKPFAHAQLCDAISRNIDRQPGGVLIVEDDPDARELLKRYVSDDFVGSLRVATDGASALAMLEHQLPDLVVLDLKMPYVDGFTFLETIQLVPRLRHLAVIVVTAQHLTAQQRVFLSERTIAVLEKGATLEGDLARELSRLPAAQPRVPVLAAS